MLRELNIENAENVRLEITKILLHQENVTDVQITYISDENVHFLATYNFEIIEGYTFKNDKTGKWDWTVEKVQYAN